MLRLGHLPLIILFKDHMPIFNNFLRQYQTGSLAPNGHQVQYYMVENDVQLIGKELVTMGSQDPCVTSQVKLYIRIRFQYWRYSKKEPPPNWVHPTPLQVILHISSIAIVSG